MFELQSNMMMLLSIVLFVVKGFALVDCVSRSEARLAHVETLPKHSWLIILTLAVLVHVFWWSPLSILNLLGTVAALVYLAQVRGAR